MRDDKSTTTYILPSGAEVEIETRSERRVGAADVAFEKRDRFELAAVIAPLGEVAELLFTEIKSRVRQPDSITVEFGASIKGQTRLLIVSGETEGNIKVSLTWKRTSND